MHKDNYREHISIKLGNDLSRYVTKFKKDMFEVTNEVVTVPVDGWQTYVSRTP